MAIVADIADLTAAEFLLTLSLNRKTGKLSAIRHDLKILVAFHEGSIVYAASTSVRERVGSLLVSRKLVREEDLHAAIQRQRHEAGVKHLGTILIEMGAISREALEEVVRTQFQRVLAELLSWPDGVITFTRMEIPDLDAVHVNPRDILLDMGLETERLVLGTLSELEDARRDAELRRARASSPAESRPLLPRHQPPAHGGPPPVTDPQAVIRNIMEEMRELSPALTAEATLQILTRAAEAVDRAVLLLVFPDFVGGVGGFGVARGGEAAEAVVRQLVIPRDHDSVFARVIAGGRTFLGPLGSAALNQHLLAHLGGPEPEEAVVVPMTVEDRVVALLYGDNAPSGRPIGDPGSLERAMREAALTTRRDSRPRPSQSG